MLRGLTPLSKRATVLSLPYAIRTDALRDLESQGIQLYEDLPLIVYTDDANDDGERDDLAAGFSFHGGARPHQLPVRRR